jgi:hypothetical protein
LAAQLLLALAAHLNLGALGCEAGFLLLGLSHGCLFAALLLLLFELALAHLLLERL